MKRPYDYAPRCPKCGGSMIFEERRRRTWHEWDEIWHCRCGYDLRRPEPVEVYDDDTQDKQRDK